MVRYYTLQWCLAITNLFVFTVSNANDTSIFNIPADGSIHHANMNTALGEANKFVPLASLPTDYFRSSKTGNWNDITTWESSDDNVTWENATLYPTSNAEGILIRSTHIITLSSNTTAKSLSIEAAGTLTNSSAGGGYDLIIADDGTFEPDFKIYGTYLLFGKPPGFNTNATATVYTNGLVRVDDNIKFQSEDFAASSNVTFNNKAVFEWNIDKPFKTSGAVYFPNSNTEIPIFRVSKDPGSVGTGALTINGILDVNVDFTFIGGSNKIFRNGIVGNSTLTQHNITNNRFTIEGSDAILGGTSLTIILSSPLHLKSSVTVPKDSFVTITGAALNNYADGNIFSIEGTIDVTDVTIMNTEKKTIHLSGTYRTKSAGGFSGGGSSIPSLVGTILIQPGSTIELYRSGNQHLLVRHDFSNVIFSGGGIKTVSSLFAPKGTITIKDNAILNGGVHNIGDGNTNLTMTDNSKLILNTFGRNPGVDGIYNLTGGMIQFNNLGSTKQTIRGTTALPVAGTSVVYNQIEVTGNNVGIGNGNINLREGGMFTVKSGGVFEVNAQSIKAVTGSANPKVIVEAGAEFKTGSEHGFHGIESTVIPIGASSIHPNIATNDIILQPNSIVNYHRSSLVQTSGLQTITATVPYQHLIISGNQEKIAQLNCTIEIKENLIKTTNAIFRHNNSTVVFSGTTGAQNYVSATPQMIFNNLTNENIIGLNIRDSLSVFRALTLGTNSKLNINADITLQSNLENTANVAPIPSNASINYITHHGFIVERHIPNHPKAWQFMATPVHGDQTIHQSWQEGMVPGMNKTNNTPGASGNSKPGYGTTITSDRPSWAADGFDLFTAPGPSLKTYNSFTNKWEGVPSTNIPVQNKEGYLLMVRGDRSVIEHDQEATATTLRTRGRIYFPGTLPPSITVPHIPGIFVSVGNPYASAIEFNKTDRINLSESYIIWDPQLTIGAYSQYGLGAYRTITSDGFAVPGSGNYSEVSIPPIQSSQAFIVQLAPNATGAGSISFTESAKTSGSSSVFRGNDTFIKPEAHLRANLYVPIKDDLILLDGNLIQLHSRYSAFLDQLDVIKMMNTGENLGILSHSKTLAIERKPLFKETDTIFYFLSGLKKQTYELEFISQKMDISGLEVYVEDNHMNQQTLLNLTGVTRIGFEVNNEPGSYNKNRFRIIFKGAKGPLPVAITHFTAEAQNNKIFIKWLSENESGIEKYIVEKSSNGIQFNSLSEMAAKNGHLNNYQTIDQKPLLGNNFYRLKIMSENEAVRYSETVKVDMRSSSSFFSLQPNPVEHGIVNLHFTNQVQGMYYLRLLNLTGQVISSKSILYSGQNNLEIFDIKHEPVGVYYLEITKPNGDRKLLKVVN